MADGQTTTFFDAAREIVAAQQQARDNFRVGVCWGGMAPSAPVVETVDAVAARLQATTARAIAFRKTPRGRFVTAIDALQSEGDTCEVGLALRGYFNRSLADEREPLNLEAVGRCLQLLAPIDTQDAQAAELALADLLIEAARAEAA